MYFGKAEAPCSHTASASRARPGQWWTGECMADSLVYVVRAVRTEREQMWTVSISGAVTR